jgi:hypothetical protein
MVGIWGSWCLGWTLACGGGAGGGPTDAGAEAVDATTRAAAMPDGRTGETGAAAVDGARDSAPLADATTSDGPSSGPVALLVVGLEPLGAGDAALRQRLQKLGFQVLVAVASSASQAQQARDLAPGKNLVVITQTVDASNVSAGLFRDVAVPLICLEPFLFDDVRMVEPRNGDGVGYVENQTQVEITNADHPLAAGQKSGRYRVTTAPRWFTWGRPLDGAIKVATVVGAPSEGIIFAYEKGAPLWKMNAPARRVALFPHDSALPVLNDTGWALVDAAIRWASGR